MHAWLIEWGLVLLTAWAGYDTRPRYPLTFDDRVRAQEAIERVYYEHRVWPKENPGPKPPFEQMISRAQIEAKVEDYLKKCAALDKFWQRPIQPEQLQAEMDRMAKQTQDPETLKELFAALDNDPYLIAECLARPILVDRLIHNWYAYDTRFHKEAIKKANKALKELTPQNIATYPEGTHSQVKYVLEISSAKPLQPFPAKTADPRVVLVDEDHFNDIKARLPRLHGPLSMRETENGFILERTIGLDGESIQQEQLSFPKQDFTSWWNSQVSILAGRMQVVIEGSGLFTLSVIASSAGNSTEGHWIHSSLNAFPDGRYLHTAVWTGTEMIVWGGRDGLHWHSTGGRYDPATEAWISTAIGGNAPSGRVLHSAIWTGTEMIVWGGYSQNTILDTGGRYNPSTDSWLPTSASVNVPSARTGHTAIWTGKEMIVWGGADYSSWFNTGARYNPSSDSWIPTSTGTNAPVGRLEHTAIWTGAKMIIWGGVNYTDPPDSKWGYLNTGGCYDPTTDSWTNTSVGVNVPSWRSKHTAVWTGNEMIIWGGGVGDSDLFNSGGIYAPLTNSWKLTSIGSNVPSMRAGHTAVWTGAEMIIWGGGIEDYNYLNTGARYNPIKDSWTPTCSGGNVPEGRKWHVAVWTGTEMIIWGGMGMNNWIVSADGRYNPSADSWVPMYENNNVPAARFGHTTIWTGTEMIVWGGSDAIDYSNTGSRYMPSLDSWMPTSIGADAPSPRSWHTAIWTGKEMIIWGGAGITGGRYSPSTDSWIPTSTEADVPLSRNSHTAVWTGTEMIIWGGFVSYQGDSNSGGRYDPELDLWAPTSAGSNVPSPREGHTAVWTGKEMIVWGGLWMFNGISNTGGKYDPSTDSWIPTSMGTSAPSSRWCHTAVWTGTEMIIWGGFYGTDSIFNNGARYEPSTDSWISTSSGPNVPSHRRDHTAIWTGTEMIVWGGVTGHDPLGTNTGGRYTPSTDSWNSTSIAANAPAGRWWHTAIWTGSEMIVWGGYADGFLISGGIYRPNSSHERPVGKPE